MFEYYGKTIGEAIYGSLSRERNFKNINMPIPAKKREIHNLPAPIGGWSDWFDIWATFGVIGFTDFDKRTVKVSFQIIGRFHSSFSVQIKGGDQIVHANGPGSANVTITGNTATQLSIRLISHSLPLVVRVSV